MTGDSSWRPPDQPWQPPAIPVPQVAAPGYAPPPLPYPPSVPPPPRGARPLRPVRIDPVPGTHFGIAYPELHPTVSGLAVGSMVAGIGSVMVSLLVGCFGLTGAQRGWGALVAGAFTVLAVAVGAGALGTAFAALRQIRRSVGESTGRGLAITGLTCGSVGAGLALLGLFGAVLLSA